MRPVSLPGESVASHDADADDVRGERPARVLARLALLHRDLRELVVHRLRDAGIDELGQHDVALVRGEQRRAARRVLARWPARAADAIRVTYSVVPAPWVRAIVRGLVTSALASMLNASGLPALSRMRAALGGQRDLGEQLAGRRRVQVGGLEGLDDDELERRDAQHGDEQHATHPQPPGRRRGAGGGAARRGAAASDGSPRTGAGRGGGHQRGPAKSGSGGPRGAVAAAAVIGAVPRRPARRAAQPVRRRSSGRPRGRSGRAGRGCRLAVRWSARRWLPRPGWRCGSPRRPRWPGPRSRTPARGRCGGAGPVRLTVGVGRRGGRGGGGALARPRRRRRRSGCSGRRRSGAAVGVGRGAVRSRIGRRRAVRGGGRGGRGGGTVAMAAVGVPTTVTVPSGATTSRAESCTGTMPSSVARWASAGAASIAVTSRRSCSLCSLSARAATRASCSRYESAAAAVESHSVTTSPVASSAMISSTNLARPAGGAVRGARSPTSAQPVVAAGVGAARRPAPFDGRRPALGGDRRRRVAAARPTAPPPCALRLRPPGTGRARPLGRRAHSSLALAALGRRFARALCR